MRVRVILFTIGIVLLFLNSGFCFLVSNEFLNSQSNVISVYNPLNNSIPPRNSGVQFFLNGASTPLSPVGALKLPFVEPKSMMEDVLVPYIEGLSEIYQYESGTVNVDLTAQKNYIYLMPMVKDLKHNYQQFKDLAIKNNGKDMYVNLKGMGLAKIEGIRNPPNYSYAYGQTAVDNWFPVNMEQLQNQPVLLAFREIFKAIAAFFLSFGSVPQDLIQLRPVSMPELTIPVTMQQFTDELWADGKVYFMPENISLNPKTEGLKIAKKSSSSPYAQIYEIDTSDTPVGKLNNGKGQGKVEINSDLPFYLGVYMGHLPSSDPQRVSRLILPGAYGISMFQLPGAGKDDGWFVYDAKTNMKIGLPKQDNPLLRNFQASGGDRALPYLMDYAGGYQLAFDKNGILSGIYNGSGQFITEEFPLINTPITISVAKTTGLNPDIVANFLSNFVQYAGKHFNFLFAGINKISVVDNVGFDVIGAKYDPATNELKLPKKLLDNYLDLTSGFSDEQIYNILFRALGHRFLLYNFDVKKGTPGIFPFLYFQGTHAAAVNYAIDVARGNWNIYVRKVRALEEFWKKTMVKPEDLNGKIIELFGQGQGQEVYLGEVYRWIAPSGIADFNPQGPYHGFLSPGYVGLFRKQKPDALYMYDLMDYMIKMKETNGVDELAKIINPNDGNYDYLHQNKYDTVYLLKLMMASDLAQGLNGFAKTEDFIDWIERQILGPDKKIDSEYKVNILLDLYSKIDDFSKTAAPFNIPFGSNYPSLFHFYQKYAWLNEAMKGAFAFDNEFIHPFNELFEKLLGGLVVTDAPTNPGGERVFVDLARFPDPPHTGPYDPADLNTQVNPPVLEPKSFIKLELRDSPILLNPAYYEVTFDYKNSKLIVKYVKTNPSDYPVDYVFTYKVQQWSDKPVEFRWPNTQRPDNLKIILKVPLRDKLLLEEVNIIPRRR